MVHEANAYSKLPMIVSSLKAKEVVCVYDDNTYKAAGERVEQYLQSRRIVLDPHELHADERAVEMCSEQLGKADLIIAVGSGTIHDIARYLANERGIEFISVPTAASVDGFVSTVAAMTWYGVKRTFPAVAPIAVVADTEVIANAPYRLTASGAGDLLGKYIALADWEVIHLITGEYLCRRVYDLTMQAVKLVRDNLTLIKQQDSKAIGYLFEGLILSGLAMQMVGNSRPASGAEHHLSHLWEMGVINNPTAALHGEKVGVAAGIICHEYKRYLDILSAGLSEDNLNLTYFDQIRVQSIYKQFFPDIKRENTPDPIADLDTGKIFENLDSIKLVLKAIPSEQIFVDMLKAVGAPSTLNEIGLDDRILPESLEYAPYLRARLTILRVFNGIADFIG